MSLLAHLGQRNIAAHKHAAVFRNTFRRGLPDYWDPLIGFQIVKFCDEVVKPRENESCSKAVRRKWGKKGWEIIKALNEL